MSSSKYIIICKDRDAKIKVNKFYLRKWQVPDEPDDPEDFKYEFDDIELIYTFIKDIRNRDKLKSYKVYSIPEGLDWFIIEKKGKEYLFVEKEESYGGGDYENYVPYHNHWCYMFEPKNHIKNQKYVAEKYHDSFNTIPSVSSPNLSPIDYDYSVPSYKEVDTSPSSYYNLSRDNSSLEFYDLGL